ncbi:MAG TPA: hypothetical protein VIX86_21155 [Streptosporangiaceae bacterium]
MKPSSGRSAAFGPGRRAACAAAAALALAGLGLAGCGAVSAFNKVKNTVEGNKSLIDTFTGKLKSAPASFEATYVTTGSSPSTVLYAVQAPKGLLFRQLATGSNGIATELVANSTGEYSCTRPSTGPGWACQKLGKASSATQNDIFSLYTPAHWEVFLRYFSLAAGFAGDKVHTSTMTVNGFSMQCVDFNAAGVKGTSTICTTSQGILGYVRVASSPTSFEIRSYSTSPSASLFQLPPGAKVTPVQ